MRSLIFLLTISIIFLSCSKEEDPVIKKESPEPQKIELISGNNQEAFPDEELPSPITIRVLDQDKQPIQGVLVNFSPSDGTGIRKVTGIEGAANYSWKLGNTDPDQTLTISATQNDGETPLEGSPITVKAKIIPLAPTSIEVVLGKYQRGFINDLLRDSVIVLVKDQRGDPVPGALINFSLAEGSLSNQDMIVGIDGKAATTWTFGASEGKQTLTINAYQSDGATHIAGSPIEVEATSIVSGISDIEGNVYRTVDIFNLTWMADNLKTTTFNDGTPITHTTEPQDWGALSTPSYCWYNNDKVYADSTNSGALYNWFTVETNKLCPAGWRVPSLQEWEDMETFLNLENHEPGEALKSTTGWRESEWSGTDAYGFNGLPSGKRWVADSSMFTYSGGNACYWSSTSTWFNTSAWEIRLGMFGYITMDEWSDQEDGSSVRCVKDNPGYYDNID